jgi:hypothetical protein
LSIPNIVTQATKFIDGFELETNSLAVASSPTSDHGVTIRTCTYVPPEIQVRESRSPMLYTVLPEEEEAFVTNVLGHERGGKEEDDEEERREGEGSTCPLPCPRRRRSALTTSPRDDGSLTSSIVDLLGMNFEGANSYVKYITCYTLK